MAGLDWPAIEAALDEQGYATTPPLLEAEECAALGRLFADERRFRSRIDMARYRFAVGEYKSFAAPLPAPAAALRTPLLRRPAPLASRWLHALGPADRYPPSHSTSR